MRIGILTHHWVYNFGANLQAIASTHILKKLGHEALIINYRPTLKEEQYLKTVIPQQAEQHELVCQRFLHQSSICRTEQEIVNVCNELELDSVWVGSDAMFRLELESTRPDRNFPNPYWLRWIDSLDSSVRYKASLAVSAMGSNFLKFPRSIRQEIGRTVADMDFVSVRDRWTQLMLLFVSAGRCWPIICPDPVFVLNEVFDIPDNPALLPFNDEKYVVLSVTPDTFNKTWIADFVQNLRSCGMRVISLPFPEGEVDIPVDYVVPLPLSPLSWYSLIKNSSGFMGYRMHPIVCSLANDVPFVSFDSYAYSRLKLLNRSYSIRFSSKTYDLCSRASMSKFCLSKKQLRYLTPKNAVDLLFSKEQENAKSFVKRAKQDFLNIVDKILAC